MFDDINKWLSMASHWPDLISLVVGTVVGFVLTMMIDLYFLPVYADAQQQRRQQGLTFLLCWTTSALASIGMWWALDNEDKWNVRIIVSVIVSVPSFWGYPYLARIVAGLLKKFLGIDLSSAWSKNL